MTPVRRPRTARTKLDSPIPARTAPPYHPAYHDNPRIRRITPLMAVFVTMSAATTARTIPTFSKRNRGPAIRHTIETAANLWTWVDSDLRPSMRPEKSNPTSPGTGILGGQQTIVLTCPVAIPGPAAPRCGVEGPFALALPSIRVALSVAEHPIPCSLESDCGSLRGGSISRSVKAPSLETRSVHGTPPSRTLSSCSSFCPASVQALVVAPSGNAPVCR